MKITALPRLFIFLISMFIQECHSCDFQCIRHESWANETYENYDGKWKLRVIEDESGEYDIYAEGTDHQKKSLYGEGKEKGYSVETESESILKVGVMNGSQGELVVYFSFDGRISQPYEWVIATDIKRELVAVGAENEIGEHVINIVKMFGGRNEIIKEIKLDFSPTPATVFSVDSAKFNKNGSFHVEYRRGEQEVIDSTDVKF